MADMNAMRLGISPLPIGNASASPAFSSHTIDATNDSLMVAAFWAQEAATITHLGFRYSLRTGTPVAHKISLQGVNSSGNPDGTVKGGGSPAEGSFTPPADSSWDSTFQWVALDNSYAVSRGELLSIVVEPTGTPNGSNNSAFTTTLSVVGHSVPFGRTRNSGSWNSQTFQTPIYGYKSSTKSYGTPIQSVSTYTIGTTTDPDEVAAKFTIPSSACSTYKLLGARVFMSNNSGNADCDFVLYQGTTELDSATVDGTYRPNNASGTPAVYWADGDTLTAGTEYSIAFRPTATTTLGIWYAEYTSEQDADSCPGGSLVGCQVRVDAGSWTADDTRRLFVELYLEDMTASGGGGGLLTHPGMSGGARG